MKSTFVSTATAVNALAVAEGVYENMVGHELSRANINASDYFITALKEELDKAAKEKRHAAK